MEDYKKLAEAMRNCSKDDLFCDELDCPYKIWREDYNCIRQMLLDGANAIEDLMLIKKKPDFTKHTPQDYPN
ncbi:MAG: hypothetical protein J5725_10345 [Bacteroidales bacterium]|nr:hypothetical protein [Bacteroidales bacterium]